MKKRNTSEQNCHKSFQINVTSGTGNSSIADRRRILSISFISPHPLSSVTTKPYILCFDLYGEARPSERVKMSLNSILSAEAVENAVKEFQAPESFSFKKFFQLCGLSSKSPKEVKDVFLILDSDNSGYIEEAELKFFLQRFVPGARTLTDAECKGFMSAADDDNDGRIGVEEFLSMVQS
ncbi:hypothetical protein DPEC_G00357350 [Dallia pectoralis]|uniref:Uncharacterized protein n=1 Tax=Dallia pectoralis TaxID=75939 RepID=A0ACC2EZZ9_DALPE|nr:hypothetical protein DPEC_G00357350 [Dallia pectoralis]